MSLLSVLQRPTKIYDLSVSLTNGMAASPSHTPYSMALAARHGDRDRNGKGGTSANALIVTGDHVGTHIDALCHVGNKGVLHGGVLASDACQGGRFISMGAETIKPMVCRGVLLDIPTLKDTNRLEPGYSITDTDLKLSLGSTPLNSGDVCLIRTGWIQQFGNAKAFLGEETGVPGVGESAGKWLAAHDIRAAGADTITFDAIELGPNVNQRPCHGVLLWEHGIHIIEVMDLEELARDGVKEFLFVLSPLKLVGATGAPVRPLAIVEV
ncbi:cyclase family protein [Stipitochalara longipes BDJ]|nr:cyclase family protein [Stipitochalara longipes BDJ]